ncbi:MAG: hypothetical protein LBP70_00735 [Mycoplasmataceae bacterium]|jgi:ribosomal protein L21E|nr:hypothetical protein [Mycoplasmataceae bacterium]
MLTYRRQQNLNWLNYIKQKFYKHLFKNVFKLKYSDANTNYEVEINNYLKEREQEGRRITYITLLVYLIQWMKNTPQIHKREILCEWESDDDIKIKIDTSDQKPDINYLDSVGICLAKSQAAYILNIKLNTVKWCFKAFKRRNMGMYIKNPGRHIKTMQWVFKWAKSIISHLNNSLHQILLKFHFRSIRLNYDKRLSQVVFRE